MTSPLFAPSPVSLTTPLVVPTDEQTAPTVGAARLRKPSPPGLGLDWLDLLAAGLTVGKPDFLAALAHPPHAALDAHRRIAFLLGHLMEERMSDTTMGLVRSPVYECSDPTEKAAVAYNVAMATSLCFARARLGIGYLTHVDVRFGSVIGQRPDLVDASDDNAFVEVKGATGPPQQEQMSSALEQLRHNPFGSPPWRLATATCAGFRIGRRNERPRLSLHVQHLVDPLPVAVPMTNTELRDLARGLAGDVLVSVFGPIAVYVAAAATGLFASAGFDFFRPPTAQVWTIGADDGEYAVAFEPYLRRFVGLEIGVYRTTMAALKERNVSFETHRFRSLASDVPFADSAAAVRGALLFTVEQVPERWWR